jgi:hypothetical protein
MLRVRRRIESLEREILLVDNPGPPEIMTIAFVNSEKKVVDTLEIKMAPVRSTRSRRWRAASYKGVR